MTRAWVVGGDWHRAFLQPSLDQFSFRFINDTYALIVDELFDSAG